MKHIRKFNESIEDFDTNYINDCFIEFVDFGAETEISDYDDGRKYYTIIINLPGVGYKDGHWSFNKENTLLGNLKYAEELVEFYKDIEDCIEKVKIKYPNIDIDFDIDEEIAEIGNEGLFDAYVILSLVQVKI
jgi:hypothetical protein